MTAYDMKLTNRARIWALLCMASRTATAVAPERLLERDPVDGEALLARLEAGGLLAATDDGYTLTARGLEAAARTLAEGVPPRLVMHDPHEWRQRAWMTAQIYRTFTASDIARAADAPSYDAVQRYCAALVAGGHAAEAGDVQRGTTRVRRYRLTADDGPMCPVSRQPAPPTAYESDTAAPLRARGWQACRRLGASGTGFTKTDIVVAAGLKLRTVTRLVEDLMAVGAVVKAGWRGQAGGTHVALYGLTLDADERAAPLFSRAAWQSRAWGVLRSASAPLSAQELTDLVGRVDRRTIHDYLDALFLAGLATRAEGEPTGVPGGNPFVFALTRSAPVDPPTMPGGWLHKKARRAAAAAEVPDA